MKTLTNTQINKTLKLIKKNGIRSINFYKEHLTIVFDFIENTQTTYVNGITQNDMENLNNNEMLLLIKKMINKKEYTYVIKSMFNTTKKQFLETLKTKEEFIQEEETEVYFEQERMYKDSKSVSKIFKNKVSYLSKNLKICGIILDIDSQIGIENQLENYIKENYSINNLKLIRVVDLRQKEIELKK